MSSDVMVFEGVVRQAHRAGTFDVELESGMSVLGHLSGRMRQARIRVLVGDRVRIEVSPYDLGKGRITYRWK